jgi:hypothetical protein
MEVLKWVIIPTYEQGCRVIAITGIFGSNLGYYVCISQPFVFFQIIYWFKHMDTRNDRFVWYASYGSNLCKERFLCYIEGGSITGLTVELRGCKQKIVPEKHKYVKIPHSLYLKTSIRSQIEVYYWIFIYMAITLKELQKTPKLWSYIAYIHDIFLKNLVGGEVAVLPFCIQRQTTMHIHMEECIWSLNNNSKM